MSPWDVYAGILLEVLAFWVVLAIIVAVFLALVTGVRDTQRPRGVDLFTHAKNVWASARDEDQS